MSGTRMQELMELGGWKSFEMVLRYAHLAPEHLAEVARRIERPLGIVKTKPHDSPMSGPAPGLGVGNSLN
jgi:hypothetical protein